MRETLYNIIETLKSELPDDPPGRQIQVIEDVIKLYAGGQHKAIHKPIEKIFFNHNVSMTQVVLKINEIIDHLKKEEM